MPPAQFRVLENFVTEEEHAAVLREIEEHRAVLRRTAGAGGLGPRYSVIAGDVIAASLPRVGQLAERVRGEVEAFAGTPLSLFADPVRRMRVQCYEDMHEGFRWHFDGHAFAAIVTLRNETGGVTEIVRERISRIVRPFFYLAYPFPQIFSLLPRQGIEANERDVLLLRGRRALHRGRSTRPGRRTILVFAYDVPGATPTRFASWFARWVNY
jgi:hypothetical protein